ncbi:hypothetical protein F5Y04DRAFT_191224 [Hypomontagnella monticulosa]|nr:hypothetical protein F5Y04DRAFT_191224 [Hypomontagnella monticulosa]
MCYYVNVTYRCGHQDLLAGPNCKPSMEQLSRIHTDASAWTTPGRRTLPFEWPDECHPNEENTTKVTSDAWCGWECRNTGVNWDEVADILASTSADIDMNGDWDLGMESGMGSGSGAVLKTPEHQVRGNTPNGSAGPYHVSNARRMSWYWDYGSATVRAMGGEGMESQERAGSQEGGVATGVGTLNMEGGVGRLGMEDAQYGVPRRGVGWREDNSLTGFQNGDLGQGEVIMANSWLEDGYVFD